MALPEEASAAEAQQAGVTPTQVRQQMKPKVATRPAGGGVPRPTPGGMDLTFQERLNALIAASGGRLRVNSGYRSEEQQARLWAQALEKYGSAAAARKWVAPPGKSNHGKGIAADLADSQGRSLGKSGDPALTAWVHQNAARFGLYFPMSWEPWHAEPIGSRSGKVATAGLDANDPEATEAVYSWNGPMASEDGYTCGPKDAPLMDDPVGDDPRKEIGYQLSVLESLFNSEEFLFGDPEYQMSDRLSSVGGF